MTKKPQRGSAAAVADKYISKSGGNVAPDFVEPVAPNENTLETIRDQLRAYRDIEERVTDLNTVLSGENANLRNMRFEILPTMFMTAGVDNLGLPAEGNHKAFDAKLKPYYHASIAAGWPEEKRAAAFAELSKRGAASLIKTTITVYLDRTDRAKAKAVIAALKKLKVEFETNLSVHSGTLTAWLKEQIGENGVTDIPLDVFGATVGNTVELKERKATIDQRK